MLFWMIAAAVVAVVAYFIFVAPIVGELSKTNAQLSTISAQLDEIKDHLEGDN
jgi:type II secretory pathway component PulM